MENKKTHNPLSQSHISHSFSLKHPSSRSLSISLDRFRWVSIFVCCTAAGAASSGGGARAAASGPTSEVARATQEALFSGLRTHLALHHLHHLLRRLHQGISSILRVFVSQHSASLLIKSPLRLTTTFTALDVAVAAAAVAAFDGSCRLSLPYLCPPPLDFFYSLRKIKTNSKGLGVSTASIATLLVGIPALHLALLGSAFATARAFGLTRPQQVLYFL